VLEQLVQLGADRKSCLVGIGGGVITDLTGYVASIYMRGISFGFVPTSLLAMVDASIGGKNGINIGIYKNMVGTIRQPEFILFDPQLLTTLPDAEWKNGFAEIIKHACIRDARMFVQLEKNSLPYYQRRPKALLELIRRNALLKTRIVQRDEWEQGERRLLNFGHTLGHALENTYELSHGQAISIGMTYATELSQHLLKFSEGGRVLQLLQQYGLPTYAQFNVQKVLQVLQKDKKKVGGVMNYILLKKLGKGVVHPIPMVQFSSLVRKITKVT
ncbi:MAG: 3-dehydroquinate synthase, partial [Chitinophagaceae bacterium]